jgi:hypothetical protein
MPFMNDDRSHDDPTAPESSVPGPARGGNPNGVDLLDINEIAAGFLFAACLPALGHDPGGAGGGTATPPAGI